MINRKYLVAIVPLVLVLVIHLVGLHLDAIDSCTIFSQIKEPCLAYGLELSWFGTIATFNVIFGWFAGFWSIFRVGKLLGEDLPRPWGNRDKHKNL